MKRVSLNGYDDLELLTEIDGYSIYWHHCWTNLPRWCEVDATFITTIDGVDIWKYHEDTASYYGVRGGPDDNCWIIYDWGPEIPGQGHYLPFPQPVIDFCLAHAALAS